MAKKAKKAKKAKTAKTAARPAKKRVVAAAAAMPPPPPMRRTCGTMEVHHRLLEQFPEYRAALGRIELATSAHIAAAAVEAPQLVTIPVVVHVVFNTNDENISDQQVQSEIDSLNKDYSATNPDRSKVPPVWSALAVDSMIRFALAKTDPNGQPTNGITRTRTTATSFTQQDNAVKSTANGGKDGWPSDKYLNIWVCSLGNGLLGYAQFPGGPATTDGVVILNRAFGTVGTAAPPFNGGRSATHEIGHWLNLRHIWGDTENCSGTDFVDDTPNAQQPNFGKPAFPHESCTNGPDGDMFMNYMDYVDDDSMVMFTAGQVARMQATLAGPRATIVANAAALTG